MSDECIQHGIWRRQHRPPRHGRWLWSWSTRRRKPSAGLASGSLALLADAGHMVSDAARHRADALRDADSRAGRPRRRGRLATYRAEILAALVNGASLVGIAIFILVEAFERLYQTTTVEGPLMLAIAGRRSAGQSRRPVPVGGGQHGNLNIAAPGCTS